MYYDYAKFYHACLGESGSGLNRVLIGTEETFLSDAIFPNCKCLFEYTTLSQVVDPFFSAEVPADENFVFINSALFIVYTILSCIGIALALACLLMNLIFKERK